MSPEQVVVTVRNRAGTFSADFELPGRVPIRQFSEQLLQGLSQQSPQLFGSWHGLRLDYNGTVLDEDDTLASWAVWDGSILTVMEGSV